MSGPQSSVESLRGLAPFVIASVILACAVLVAGYIVARAIPEPSQSPEVGRYVPTENALPSAKLFGETQPAQGSRTYIVDTKTGAIYLPTGEPWEVKKWLMVREGIENSDIRVRVKPTTPSTTTATAPSGWPGTSPTW